MKRAVKDQDISEILRDRPALVTGADGFIGSHLTEKLVAMDANVHVFVRASSSGMLNNIASLQRKVTIHRGDLADIQAIRRALQAVADDGGEAVIFHLGAQSHVGESWQRPYETVSTNVIGTMNLLQSVVDLNMNVHRIDTAGSSEEYGNVDPGIAHQHRFDRNGGLILDESSPINPQSIYATAKVATDYLTRNYHKAYGVPTLVTRMFNNYGPRQNPRFVTATVITQALIRDVIRLGYVSAKRDFCYVEDGVMGHIHAALFGEPGSVYVYGSGEIISIDNWSRLILETGREAGFWGEKTVETESEGRGRLGGTEVEELRVDYAKLNALTGWRPEYTWKQGILKTIAWYAQNRGKWMSRVDWL